MKLKKIIPIAIALGLNALTFKAVPVESAEPKDLERLIKVCFEKGTQMTIAPSAFLEKSESLDEHTDRMLYFTAVYGIGVDDVGASMVYFVEEEWMRIPGGTEVPHNYMDDKWFAKFKYMDKYMIKQKIIYDGGEFGELDGKPDNIEAKTIIKTVVGDWIIDISYNPKPERIEIEKAYDKYVEEMLDVVDKIKNPEEKYEYI